MHEHLDHQCFCGMDGYSILEHSFGFIKRFVFISISHDCQPAAGSNSSISAVHYKMLGKVGTGGVTQLQVNYF